MEFNITLEQFQNAVEVMPMEDSGDLVINATIGSTGGGGDVACLSQLIQDPLHRTVTDNEKNLWSGKADVEDIPTALVDLISDEAHRTVTDAEKETWNNKSDFSGEYADLSGKPLDFPPSVHVHDDIYYQKSAVNTLLSQKADTSQIPTSLSQLTQDANNRTVTDVEKNYWNEKSEFSGSYNDLTGIPQTFAPSTHIHNVSDVTNLQENLDSKESVLLSSQKLRIMLSTGDPTGTDWDIWIKHEA